MRAVAASAPRCVRDAFGVNARVRRKLAIATGAGTANGVTVVLTNWGLDDVAAVV